MKIVEEVAHENGVTSRERSAAGGGLFQGGKTLLFTLEDFKRRVSSLTLNFAIEVGGVLEISALFWNFSLGGWGLLGPTPSLLPFFSLLMFSTFAMNSSNFCRSLCLSEAFGTCCRALIQYSAASIDAFSASSYFSAVIREFTRVSAAYRHQFMDGIGGKGFTDN